MVGLASLPLEMTLCNVEISWEAEDWIVVVRGGSLTMTDLVLEYGYHKVVVVFAAAVVVVVAVAVVVVVVVVIAVLIGVVVPFHVVVAVAFDVVVHVVFAQSVALLHLVFHYSLAQFSSVVSSTFPLVVSATPDVTFHYPRFLVSQTFAVLT